MIAHVIMLVASALAARVVAAAGASPTPTPVPEGIHATFAGLAERQGVTFLTYAHGGGETTVPFVQTPIVRERPVGGDWKVVDPTTLREGAPIVVFLNQAGEAFQVDTLYAEVTTRFVLVKNGFGVTPAGKIYRLTGQAQVVGAALPEGAYVRLRVDPTTEVAYDLLASRTPFPENANVLRVVVTIEVVVPVNTPPTDVVYMSTDALSWTPNAIRMAPQPGGRWTVALSLTGGSLLKYKYTRGTWQTDERDLAGNEIPNRSLTVDAKGPTQSVNDVVARWADRSS